MHERFFQKKHLFSKQIKHAMAAHHSAITKGSSYPPEQTRGVGVNKKDHPDPGAPCGAAVVTPQTAQHYENCDDEHCVGEDPEAALCPACEDHDSGEPQGYSNPNLCTSPSHSPTRADLHTETEEHTDTEADQEVTMTTHHVVKIGSLIQHTFHFPVSDCPHLNNSLCVDSEDGSEDGNYGHFVPLSHLLKDPKAKQFYSAARTDSASPCRDFTEAGAPVMCNENGHLITGV